MKPPVTSADKTHQQFFRRILVAGAFILLGLLGMTMRYGYLQVTAHAKYNEAAEANRIKLLYDPPSRGYIYDRNGHILADNKPVFSAILTPSEVVNLEETLLALAPIFELDSQALEEIRTKAHERPRSPITLKMDLSESQIARFSERKVFFEGVDIETKLTRTYPHGALFAHVLGYVGRINDKESIQIAEDETKKTRYTGTDLIGKIGIESHYEDLLMGEPGYRQVEVDAHRHILRELSTAAPIAGNDLHLSLDYGLQKTAAQTLDGRRGAIVAIDPKTGEVLAFVSNPSFDPNLFVSGISFADYDTLRDDPDEPLYNRALQGQYPPASTIKPFLAMGLLHHNVMDWGDVIFDPGYFSLPGDSHKFRDWKRGGHGSVDMTKSIVQSVDTYYYKSAYTLGIERMHDWMSRFGFGHKTGIDLPSERAGVMPSPAWKKEVYDKDWLPGETISVSIGQGYFLATPLQVANATAMMAAKGAHITPHLLKESQGAKAVAPLAQADGVIAFDGSQDDWQRMSDAMVETVKKGTARGIFTPQYTIAGKTGTAQVKSIAQGKSYNKAALDKRHWDHAWFNGFAPAEDPQIALAVLVENGGGGGAVAAPIARQLFDYWLIQKDSRPIVPKVQP